jgi:hypothetical protein
MLKCAIRWICFHCSWQGFFNPGTTCPVCGNPVTRADI